MTLGVLEERNNNDRELRLFIVVKETNWKNQEVELTLVPDAYVEQMLFSLSPSHYLLVNDLE